MAKSLFILLFSFCVLFSKAKENSYVSPDYSLIKKLTKDKNSEYYYPLLFSRYQKMDTTLKANDYKMLYYGYFFQSNYIEQGSSAFYNDSIRQIMHKDQLTQTEWKKLIYLVNNYMQTAPFDLQKVKLLFVAYHNINDEYNASLYRTRLEMLIKTILATGDGKTEKSAFHVLQVGDEYAIVSILGFDFTGEEVTTENKCDFLRVANNMDGLKGIYFDVNQIIVQLKQMMKVD